MLAKAQKSLQSFHMHVFSPRVFATAKPCCQSQTSTTIRCWQFFIANLNFERLEDAGHNDLRELRNELAIWVSGALDLAFFN